MIRTASTTHPLCPEWRTKGFMFPCYCHIDGRRYIGDEDDEYDQSLCLPTVQKMALDYAELLVERDVFQSQNTQLRRELEKRCRYIREQAKLLDRYKTELGDLRAHRQGDDNE